MQRELSPIGQTTIPQETTSPRLGVPLRQGKMSRAASTHDLAEVQGLSTSPGRENALLSAVRLREAGCISAVISEPPCEVIGC